MQKCLEFTFSIYTKISIVLYFQIGIFEILKARAYKSNNAI